jgi:hypothetical protein
MKRKIINTDVLMTAIHRKCMECSGESRNEVKSCKIKECPLFPFRCRIADETDDTGEIEGQISMDFQGGCV